MSNKEIEKQAEELIGKHCGHPLYHRNWLDDKVLKKDLIPAIKAAIVSCEFAITNFEMTVEEEITYEIKKMKKYLEGLL